jgi:hypothetical protein
MKLGKQLKPVKLPAQLYEKGKVTGVRNLLMGLFI